MVIQFDDIEPDDIITIDAVDGKVWYQVTGRFVGISRWSIKRKHYRVSLMLTRIDPRGRRYEELTHIPTDQIKRVQREEVKA